jgi:general secretion pathway protein D
VFSKKYLCFCILLVCLLSYLPGRVCAQPQKSASAGMAGEKVSLDFKEVELTDLIQTVSELTGKNFIYDDAVKGKVTIISPNPVALDEAYQLFLTVLNVKGFTIVPSGKVNKIVATREAKESNLPTQLPAKGSEQYVTRLIPLRNIDATVIANTVLSPLIPKTSNIVAYPPSNTLIITDSGANIERLVQIIQELDVPSSLDLLEVVPLEYATAEEVAQICSQVITQVAATPGPGRVARNVATAGAKEISKIIPFVRTNTLVVMATEEDMVTIRNLVKELDQKPSQERSHINVYYLENADAETLGKTLNEILAGIKSGKPPQTGQTPLATEAVSITADKPTNSLIINSTPEDYEIIKGIVGRLDIKRKQVFVEALILELSMDATRKLGMSLQGAVATASDSAVFGTSNLNSGPVGISDFAPKDGVVPSVLSKAVDGILLGGLFSPIEIIGPDGEMTTVPALSALIDISKTDSDLNILSAPRLLTSDNEEAEIIVGSNVPIITQRLTDTGGTEGLAQSVSVERQDVALTLRITPQITEGDLVRLNVYQEITGIATSSVGDVNQVGPTLTKRMLRNTVLAENGRTVVLGGLIGNNVQKNITKVPLLGDIPVLGWLFKRKNTEEKKTNLLIFVTPKIIKDASDLEEVTHKSREIMERFRKEEMRSSVPTRFESDLISN